MHFIRNGYKTLFMEQLEQSKATCPFNGCSQVFRGVKNCLKGASLGQIEGLRRHWMSNG